MSPEIIRLAVMMYVRFPLSLRNFEDLLYERSIDISHETVRFAADASLIEADANTQNSTPKEDWDYSAINPKDAPRAVKEYLDVFVGRCGFWR